MALSPNIVSVHDVFHVSILGKYVADPSHILWHKVLDIEFEATYEEKPLRILDRKDKELRSRSILMVKVQWGNHTEEEETSELESTMREKYPLLF